MVDALAKFEEDFIKHLERGATGFQGDSRKINYLDSYLKSEVCRKYHRERGGRALTILGGAIDNLLDLGGIAFAGDGYLLNPTKE